MNKSLRSAAAAPAVRAAAAAYQPVQKQVTPHLPGWLNKPNPQTRSGEFNGSTNQVQNAWYSNSYQCIMFSIGTSHNNKHSIFPVLRGIIMIMRKSANWLKRCESENQKNKESRQRFGCASWNFDGILPKGPYLPCLRMADRALLAGYPWNPQYHVPSNLSTITYMYAATQRSWRTVGVSRRAYCTSDVSCHFLCCAYERRQETSRTIFVFSITNPYAISCPIPLARSWLCDVNLAESAVCQSQLGGRGTTGKTITCVCKRAEVFLQQHSTILPGCIQ